MFSEHVSSVWIGCATDGRFVMPTCAMLSSLDDNGNVPEATVVVADFGLTDQDRAMLRTSAGRLGERMRFLPLDRTSPEIVALPKFDFPLPLLGRFAIPRSIKARHARLLTIDSDMIVNSSVRPLFEMYMRGYAIGAVHDSIAVREHYGREADPEYFNAGLMLIDLDRFNAADIGGAAMRRLAAYDERPMWLDQDALNDIMGDNWLTLDRRWNFFHAADRRGFTTADYNNGNIIHFSGGKPWDEPHHPGASFYFHHARRVGEKLRGNLDEPAGGSNRVFIATCYEILLGRQLETDAVLTERRHLTPTESVACIIASPEFKQAVIDPLCQGAPIAVGRFSGKPSRAQRYWASDRLPIIEATAAKIETAQTWRVLLGALIEDRYFMSIAKLQPQKAVAKTINLEKAL